MPGPARDLPLRHIVRINSPRGSGWQLRIPTWHPKGPETLYFSDGKHGGEAAALIAARQARDLIFARANLPLRLRGQHPHQTVGLKNNSGLTGVCIQKDSRRNVWAWCAFWSVDKQQVKKRFGIYSYGYDRAFWLAVELRQAKTGIAFPASALKQALAEHRHLVSY